MTALTKAKARSFERLNQKQFTLTSGSVAYKGGQAVLGVATGKVVPAAAGVGLRSIGTFAENMDASSADKLVNIDLGREVVAEWLANSGTNPVAATDLGSMAYLEDDQTAGISPAGFSPAGIIWGYSATQGVLVERLVTPRSTLDGLNGVNGATLAFTAADIVIGNNPKSGTIYDVPTSAANSTISLPATAVEGTILYFKADGTKNGHTVQYRDVTTAITAALTASKRHLVVCVFSGSKWFANAAVSP